MSETKFKVGDKVKMLTGGEIGYITDIKLGAECPYMIKTPKNRFECDTRWFEAAPDNIMETPQQTSGGRKNDSEKPDLSLIPTDALWGMAAALTYGAKKYERHNFREGIAFSRLVAAAMRHLTAWNEGENKDSETSLSHLDHCMASLAMLKFMDVNRQDMDDRWLNPIHGHDLHPNEKIQPITVTEDTDIFTADRDGLYQTAASLQKRGR